VSLALYWWKTVWPRGLAHFYPHPGGTLALPEVVAALAGLAAVSLFAVCQWRRRPWLGFAWFWYLVTVLPVIGVVQVSAAAMADRYTYLPFLGPVLALAVAAAGVPRSRRELRRALAVTVLAATAAAALLAHRQVGVWRNHWTLSTHAVAVTRDNWVALHDVGHLLTRRQRWAEAVGWYRASVAAMPSWHASRYNLGKALMATGDYAGAAGEFAAAVRIEPRFAEARLAEVEARRRLERR
jgi:tetratricopeptide (TPR) repeat protein